MSVRATTADPQHAVSASARRPRATLAILRKVGIALFVVWGAVTLIFILIRIAPGDTAVALLGPTASQEQLDALRLRLGLNDSVLQQYWIYLSGVLTGDFGDSVRLGRPAMQAVLERLPATLQLTFSAALIAVVAGIPLGVVAGRRPGGVIDRSVSAGALVVKSIPAFWLGIMLILLFARLLRILPSFGSGSLLHLILPAVTLALPFLAIVIRLMRSSVVEALGEPYVQAARSKGISERAILAGHVVPNSLLPVVTLIGLQLGTLLGGAVVTESVFSWPGIGLLLVQSVAARDYVVVQAIAVVVAVMVVVINLLTDLLYGRLDPRIRVGGRL